MSDKDDTRQAAGTTGRLHRLLDWSLFPASVAVVCVSAFSLIFGAVAGRRADTEVLAIGVAVVSALVASFVKRPE